MDTNAVQRHRNIILDCLRDGDISIRRRALELSYALINEQNVRLLVRELLAFLEVADTEFKLGMTTQISLAAERFAPNKRWHIDTCLRVLKLVRISVSLLYARFGCGFPDVKCFWLIGWKLCPRGNSVIVHPTSRAYTRVAGIYRIQVVYRSASGYLTGVADSGRCMDYGRIQRNSP